jgi:pSer/pThr/pTyr-binding forkhead associated (FHA) protein
MRYIFLALIVYILLRLIGQSIKEYDAVREAKKSIRGISPGYLLALSPETLMGLRFELRKEMIIGRSSRCDVIIKTKDVAPVHAAIYEKKGHVYLADYGSRTGTFVNGERVERKDRLLMPGDNLRIGEAGLTVNLYGEEKPIE